MSFLVVREILNEEHEKARAEVISHFIKIAKVRRNQHGTARRENKRYPIKVLSNSCGIFLCPCKYISLIKQFMGSPLHRV